MKVWSSSRLSWIGRRAILAPLKRRSKNTSSWGWFPQAGCSTAHMYAFENEAAGYAGYRIDDPEIGEWKALVMYITRSRVGITI